MTAPSASRLAGASGVTGTVPGTAASAPAGCSAACWVAAAPELLPAAGDGPERAGAGADVPEPGDAGAGELAVAQPLAAGRFPLLTNPATPWAASGPGYSWALTEKFGSESPPTVDRTPPE